MDVPGPGAYNPAVLSQKHSPLTIGRAGVGAPRLNVRESLSPGPGKYYDGTDLLYKKNASTSIIFDKTSKFKNQSLDMQANMPGPGSYNIQGVPFGGHPQSTTSGAISFPRSIRDFSAANSDLGYPGPAHYDN